MVVGSLRASYQSQPLGSEGWEHHLAVPIVAYQRLILINQLARSLKSGCFLLANNESGILYNERTSISVVSGEWPLRRLELRPSGNYSAVAKLCCGSKRRICTSLLDPAPCIRHKTHAGSRSNGRFFRYAAAWSFSLLTHFSRCAHSQHKITMTGLGEFC